MDIEKELNELKEKMTPLNTMKFLAGTLISFGAAAAVFNMMRNPLLGAKGITKLLMKLGIFVLACKAGDVAEGYFKETVDKAEKELKEMQKEASANE